VVAGHSPIHYRKVSGSRAGDRRRKQNKGRDKLSGDSHRETSPELQVIRLRRSIFPVTVPVSAGVIGVMNDGADDSLLSAWCAAGSEEAFTALAKRYGGLLYHAAKRRTGREDLAQEAAQTALLILARKAPRLRHLPCLSGWLHRTACYEASKLLRREHRHEARMKHLPTYDEENPESSWQSAMPLLDQALDALPERDRQVIFLKYFDGLSFEQMAVRFGGEPAAWRQRGSRAVEKLRGSLAKRGVMISATTISTGLGATLSQTVPVSFIASVGATHGALATVSWKTLTLQSLHLMKMKPAIVISAVLLASFIPLGLQANAISVARQRVALLETAAMNSTWTTDSPRRTASARTPGSSRTDLIALADALLAGENGNALSRWRVERKIRAMDADELEQMLMGSLDIEMGTARREVLVRALFRGFCRLAEESKMPCERVVALALTLENKMGPGQGNLWNNARGTIARWMEADLDAAVAWFGETRKSGMLGDSQASSVLGSQIFEGLHRRNPEEAIKFFQGLADSERMAAICSGAARGNPELVMDLATKIGDEGRRSFALTQFFRGSDGRTAEEIRAWLDHVAPAENQGVEYLAHAARGQIEHITAELALARIDWLRKASEGRDFSGAAGVFLAEMARTNPEQIRAVLDAEWERNPDERMLASYIGRSFHSTEALIIEAIPLSQRIADPDLRDESLRRMLGFNRATEEARSLARKGNLAEEEINRLFPEKP
jgi:RNA polymerase sigma factor (sigma-70 family)